MRKISATLVLGALAASFVLCSCKKETIEPSKVPIDVSSGAPYAADFHSESALSSDYDSTILAHYRTGRAGSFTGVGGIRIDYRVFEKSGGSNSEKGAIMLLPGRTEPIEKYAEVIRDLGNQGYSVYAMSHRGQGESQRIISDPQVGYVDDFADYVADTATFASNVVGAKSHPKKFILAHSMGGGIAVNYLHDYPNDFDGAALSAPMLGLNSGVWPANVTFELSQEMVNTGKGESFVPGHGPFNPNLKFTDADNDVTRSQARFGAKMRVFLDHPALQLGGVSYKWLNRSLKMGYKADKSSFAREVKTRILLFQAGNDTLVRNDYEDRFCGAAPACQKETFSDSYHEILMERDSIRNEALAKAIRFFNKLKR
ncbi:alpha/beta fold hydrolase [Candidatus Parcubacteria bacterium]|nr:alpha/beta fold hydrolase [Candidatus Parcubacteria bacterium]